MASDVCACSYEDATCMVTVSDGKHYSLGLDLELVTGGGVNMMQYLFDVQKLFRRLLTFPVVTVAAANGIHGHQTRINNNDQASAIFFFPTLPHRSYLCSWSSLWPLS